MSPTPSDLTAARVGELVSATRATLDAATGLLGRDAVGDLHTRLAAVEQRHGFLGDAVLLALAGGTGSGKSSLLNALAGERVTRPGVLRPTTSQPFAWVPLPVEASLTRLLDAFGIDERVGQETLPNIAVIDLPDYDSVEPAHRAIVDRLVPRVDAVAWVVDPEKYNDAALHAGYLQPLAAYADQFVFVLNQVDRLRPDDVDAVVADLRSSLQRDGIPDPTILRVAADPPDGEPVGIDDLLAELGRRFDDKQVARRKLVTDLREVAAAVVRAAGVPDDGADGAVPDWDATAERAAVLVGEGVVDATAVAHAELVGGRVAVAAAGGPAGKVLHAARRSNVGRLLGLPKDEPVDDRLLARDRISGRERDAVGELREHVTATSLAVPTVVGRRLRERTGGDWIEEQVADASRRARADVRAPETVERRGWWAWLGLVQTLLTAAVVAGAVLFWLDPTGSGPGPLPHPLVLSALAVGLGLLVRRLARASGARSGREAALAHRDAVAVHVRGSLDERVGRPLRAALSDWEALRVGLAQLRSELGG